MTQAAAHLDGIYVWPSVNNKQCQFDGVVFAKYGALTGGIFKFRIDSSQSMEEWSVYYLNKIPGLTETTAKGELLDAVYSVYLSVNGYSEMVDKEQVESAVLQSLRFDSIYSRTGITFDPDCPLNLPELLELVSRVPV